MLPVQFWMLLGVLAAFLGSIIPVSGRMLDDTAVIAISGMPTPDNNGTLSTIQLPVIHNGGLAVFASTIRLDGVLVGSGISRGGVAPGSLGFVVREGDPTPNLDGNFGPFREPALSVNSTNQVVFPAGVANVLNPLAAAGLFVSDGTAEGTGEILRLNQLTPSENGRIAAPFSNAAFNDAGQVAVSTFLAGATNPPTFAGLFRGGLSPNSLIEVVNVGQEVPDGMGRFINLGLLPVSGGVLINEAGQVLFIAEVVVENPFLRYSGIFRSDDEALVEIVRSGQMTPSGNGTFGSLLLTVAAMNDVGEAAFVVGLDDTALEGADNVGVFRGDGTQMIEIVRRSDFLPDRDGRFLDIAAPIALNNSGQVLFAASISATAPGTDVGLFLGDGTTLTPVVRLGDAVPGGDGVIAGFDNSIALNNEGQVMFKSPIDLQDGGSSNDGLGLFLYDPVAGLVCIARTGDMFPNMGAITDLDFQSGLLFLGDEGSGLNDQGQAAYRFTADGNFGIAIWPGLPAPVMP